MRNWKHYLSVLLTTDRCLPRKSRIRLALCGIVMLTVTTGASALTATTPHGQVQQASGRQFVIPADIITPPAATPTIISNAEPVVAPTEAAVIIPAASPTAAAIIVPAATPTVAAIIVPAATPPADTSSIIILTDNPPITAVKSDDDDDDSLCHSPEMGIS